MYRIHSSRRLVLGPFLVPLCHSCRCCRAFVKRIAGKAFHQPLETDLNKLFHFRTLKVLREQTDGNESLAQAIRERIPSSDTKTSISFSMTGLRGDETQCPRHPFSSIANTREKFVSPSRVKVADRSQSTLPLHHGIDFLRTVTRVFIDAFD